MKEQTVLSLRQFFTSIKNIRSKTCKCLLSTCAFVAVHMRYPTSELLVSDIFA